MALKTFVTGEVLTADDTNVYLKNTIFAQKTATESVTSSTTLQDDNHLSVSVAANSVYEFTSVLHYDADSAGDLKWTWSMPAGASMTVVHVKNAEGASAITDVTVKSENESDTAGGTGASNTHALIMKGLLTISSTAGTFKLTWAQQTSSGTATRLFAGSYVCLRRVD